MNQKLSKYAQYAAPVLMLLLCAADCSAASIQGLDVVSGYIEGFLAWLRVIAGAVFLIGLVWGCCQWVAEDFRAARPRLWASVVSALVATVAQVMIKQFYGA